MKSQPRAEIPNNFADYYQRWKNGKITAKKAMNELGLTRSTFYRVVERYEDKCKQIEIDKEEKQEEINMVKETSTITTTDDIVDFSKYGINALDVINKIINDNQAKKLPRKYIIHPSLINTIKDFFDSSIVSIEEIDSENSTLSRGTIIATADKNPSHDSVLPVQYDQYDYIDDAINDGFSKFRMSIPLYNYDAGRETIRVTRCKWLREDNITNGSYYYIEFELKPNNGIYYCLDFKNKDLLTLLLSLAFKTDTFKARIRSEQYSNAEVESFFKDSIWKVKINKKSNADGTMIISISKTKYPSIASLYINSGDLGRYFAKGYIASPRYSIFRFINCDKEDITNTLKNFYTTTSISESQLNNYIEVKCDFNLLANFNYTEDYNTCSDITNNNATNVDTRELLITPQEAHELTENSRANTIKIINAAIHNAAAEGKFSTTVSTKLFTNPKCAINILQESKYTYSVSSDNQEIEIQW